MNSRSKKPRYSLAALMPDILCESADAQILHSAMDGFGTDEDAIKAVFARRASDLRALSNEYAEYTRQQGESDTDLVSWLEDDGMDSEAAQVRAAPLIASLPTTSGAPQGTTTTGTQVPAGTTPPAAGAAGLVPVTAPEVDSKAKLGAGASQDPQTKQWTLADGRVTAPLAEAPLSRGALIRQRYGRY